MTELNNQQEQIYHISRMLKRNHTHIPLNETNMPPNAHDGAVPYLSFPAIDESGIAKSGFSTRLGGVSEGYLSGMNLTFAKEEEKKEHVLENYRRMGEALGFDPKRAVLSQQTHTTNVRLVTMEDAGKGIHLERDYEDVDGLITNVPGMTLVTFYADCVPLYILDPVQHAIGLSHSGWRGTVNRMGAVTIKRMQDAFGSRAEELICCIGPSICKDCFEVGGEVAEAFAKAFFPEKALIYTSSMQPVTALSEIETEKKYFIDLWRANELVFLKAGVKRERIHTTDICTKCNGEVLWSHRNLGTRRGNLAAFLTLL